jgi:hypothetical protein
MISQRQPDMLAGEPGLRFAPTAAAGEALKPLAPGERPKQGLELNAEQEGR